MWDHQKQLIPLRFKRLLPGATILLLLVYLVSTAVVAYAGPPPPPEMVVGDLGDAPTDNMAAYTTPSLVPASFPTIYVPGAQSGPYHHNAKEGFYLGSGVSEEFNAHYGNDEDDITNIDVANDLANRDEADSLIFIQSLNECETVTFNIDVHVPGAATMFVNVWMDFNRDGAWTDTVLKPCGQLSEWVVQNRLIDLQSAQTVTLSVTPYHPDELALAPMWMRITLSDTAAPLAAGGQADGSGPPGGYNFGETEDYLLTTCSWASCARAGWRG